MSAPEPMPCLLDRDCPTPTSCHHSGSCSARRDDSAKSYDLAIAAKREAMLAQRKEMLADLKPFQKEERG